VRIRTIKPEYWRHPVLCRLPDAVRLAALGLLTMADDEGYFLGSPEQVRSDLWPAEESSEKARESLAKLLQVGYIEIRQHPTHGPIGLVLNFLKHQRVDHPTRSKLKAYYENREASRETSEPREIPLSDLGIQGSRDLGSKGPPPEASRVGGQATGAMEPERHGARLGAEDPRLEALANAGVLVDRTKNTRAEWLVALNGTTGAQVVGVLARLGRLKIPVWPSDWPALVKEQTELEELADQAKHRAERQAIEAADDIARLKRAQEWDLRALAEAPAILAKLAPNEDLLPALLANANRIREKVAKKDAQGLGFAVERLKQGISEHAALVAGRAAR
jgi:hypothetical protein